MNGWMIAKARMRSFSLVLFFAFCQIIGTMCAVQDLSMANDIAQLTEDMSGMACPMDGTFMCPPSLTASPERQLKNSVVADVNLAPISISSAATPVGFSDLIIGSLSSADSIVPISIASPSALRI
ncbi:MAG: hypothetical protein AAB308_02265 [Nitrospirota bacterium]